MGMYDHILDTEQDICIQFKGTSDPSMCGYTKNSVLEGVEDGIYLCYEGHFVVKDKIIIAIFRENQVFTKWGGVVNTLEILDNKNVANYDYLAMKHFGLK